MGRGLAGRPGPPHPGRATQSRDLLQIDVGFVGLARGPHVLLDVLHCGPLGRVRVQRLENQIHERGREMAGEVEPPVDDPSAVTVTVSDVNVDILLALRRAGQPVSSLVRSSTGCATIGHTTTSGICRDYEHPIGRHSTACCICTVGPSGSRACSCCARGGCRSKLHAPSRAVVAQGSRLQIRPHRPRRMQVIFGGLDAMAARPATAGPCNSGWHRKDACRLVAGDAALRIGPTLRGVLVSSTGSSRSRYVSWEPARWP